MSNQFKLFKDNKDIIIECLTQRITDLEHQLSVSKASYDALIDNLSFYEKYSKDLIGFEHYKLWKESVDNLEVCEDDVENLDMDFKEACKNNDIEKIISLWERHNIPKVLELMAIIEDLMIQISEMDDYNISHDEDDDF